MNDVEVEVGSADANRTGGGEARRPRSYDIVPAGLRVTAWFCYIFVAILIFLAIFTALSIHTVDESEACILTNTYRGSTSFEAITTAGRKTATPFHELICYPTTIQVFSYTSAGSGLDRAISVRASDGLEITLELTVDVEIVARDVGRLIQRFNRDGFEVAKRIVRSEVRDAASGFETAQFLTGDRVIISETALTRVRAALSPHYMAALRVNLRDIIVREDFREAFLAVEAINLDVREEQENLPVQLSSVQRENATGLVDLAGSRDRQVIAASAAVDNARLAQENELVAERTRQAEAFVREETSRALDVTNAAALVEEARAEALVNISAANLASQQRVLAASRTREVKLALAQARVSAEIARSDALVAAAETELQTTRVTEATRLLFAVEAASRLTLEAAGEAAGITATGAAAADNRRASVAADLQGVVRATTGGGGWSEQQAAAVEYFKTLGAKVLPDAKAFMDYTRTPFSNAEASSGGTVFSTVDAAGTVDVPTP